MPEENQELSPSRPRVNLDAWAVLLALVLVALVRFGWLPSIAW